MEPALGNTQDDDGTGLMQLPDELLQRTIRMQPIDPALLQLFKCLELTNKRLCNVLRQEILADHEYRDKIMNIFHVPGTNIPCWAETVQPLPIPDDMSELMRIFNENATMFQENTVHVGGAYGYGDEGQCGFDDCFEDEEDNSIYMAVEIEFGPDNLFQPDNVPLLANDMADLSRVPNIIRRVLGFLALTHSYTEINVGVAQVAKYMRLVRVLPHHTMQDVQNALARVEGWNGNEECMMMMEGGDEYESDDNVFFEFHTARTHDVILFPNIWFPEF